MNKTIGVFGGGQLGRMLAQSALPLGIDCIMLEDAENSPSQKTSCIFNTENFASFADEADVFTLEFENTPADVYAKLNQQNGKQCFPNQSVLEVAQDRLLEKQTFNQLDIKTVPFLKVESLEDLNIAVEELGLPLVLKTTRGGYDGKGQFVIKQTTDIENAWHTLSSASPLIAEGFINFEREVSIIAVRGQDGEIRSYPLIENHHHNGILSHSIAPAPNQEDILETAQQAITKLLQHFNYVGVMTLELFVTSDGIIANEIAPRVHNSGHWSIEGAVCSQFENHIRAVAGLPLGSTQIVHPSIMVNIIGEYPEFKNVLAIKNVHLHSYGKMERADRKIGHLTVMPCNSTDVSQVLSSIAAILPNKMGL